MSEESNLFQLARRYIGPAFIGIGWIWLTVCGALALLLFMVAWGSAWGQDASGSALALTWLIYVGMFSATGWILYWAGKRLTRAPQLKSANAPLQQTSELRRFIGLILIVVGALWAVASGLCSAGFFGMMVVEGGDFREALSIVPMIVLVGGFSAGLGLVFFVVGRALRPKA